MTPPTETTLPPIRACLFDMDGLLLDTEDIYTNCVNLILKKYNRPSLPWSIKAKLQGRPATQANILFHDWAQLPITKDEYIAENLALQRENFPATKPLPGIPELLGDLGRTRYWDLEDKKEEAGAGHRVHIALATSSHASNFAVKTTHHTELFSVFPSARRIMGDDARIPTGRGKPRGDIYHLALQTINDTLDPGTKPILPFECLVFEDSVPGVEAGRRAGMRVIWCPHPMLKNEFLGKEKEVLAGRMFEAGEVDVHEVGEIDDGWAEELVDLVKFPYEKYGIVVPGLEVEQEECMKEEDGSGILKTVETKTGVKAVDA